MANTAMEGRSTLHKPGWMRWKARGWKLWLLLSLFLVEKKLCFITSSHLAVTFEEQEVEDYFIGAVIRVESVLMPRIQMCRTLKLHPIQCGGCRKPIKPDPLEKWTREERFGFERSQIYWLVGLMKTSALFRAVVRAHKLRRKYQEEQSVSSDLN